MGRTPGGGTSFKRNKTRKLGYSFYEKEDKRRKRKRKRKKKKEEKETVEDRGETTQLSTLLTLVIVSF